jgi:hypothetical protein
LASAGLSDAYLVNTHHLAAFNTRSNGKPMRIEEPDTHLGASIPPSESSCYYRMVGYALLSRFMRLLVAGKLVLQRPLT